MKKVLIFALAMLVCTSCAAKKKVVQEQPQPVQQKDPQQAKIDSLKKVKEIMELEHEIELANIHSAEQIAIANSQAGLNAKLEGGVQLIITPCMDEFIALNGNPRQMAAQGISTGQATQESAELNANRIALSDITSRFLGVIKNGIEQYSKDTSTPSKNRAVEAQLEGLAMSVGEKAIKELYSVGCRQFAKDKYGAYICYEALYVPVMEVVDRIADAAEVQGVDIDKAMFRKRMEAELLSNSQKEKEALQQQREEARQKGF